jgi:DNA/RNA endonuclease YhcR with UshA esterase domain
MKHLLIFISIIAFLGIKASAQTAIAAKDAAKHIGETVTICDKVYSTKLLSGSNMTFLDLGGYHPNQELTLVIKGDDRRKFKGAPEDDYKGRNVCVTGVLVDFKGKPEIILTDPAQIKTDLKDNKVIIEKKVDQNPPGN